jgi:hypothetical protein
MIQMNGRREYATGTGNISKTITFTIKAKLKELRLHLSDVGGANGITLTLDSGLGAAYDCVLATQDLTSLTDYMYKPDVSHTFHAGDALVIAWTNGSERTYGLEAIIE